MQNSVSVASRSSWRRLGLAVLVVLAGGGLGWACNVPVFRYALEHWRPDPYRLTVLHRGPLDDDQRARLATLEEQSAKSQINVAIRTVDVEAAGSDADRQFLVSLTDQTVPRLVVQYPAALRLDAPVWTSGFGADDLAELLDSPARRELVRRLAEGQTAVWVLLATGDAAKDEPAAAVLSEELKALSHKLKLPELTESPEDILLGNAPLKISFSLLKILRDDSAERALVAMLLGCESDLAATMEPMAFPVFGRNRVLLPLVGAGITPDNIHVSAEFLTGACSCQVKNQNPGFDLLHTADWARELVLDHDPAIALLDMATTAAEPELVPIPTGATTAPPPTAAVSATTTTLWMVPMPLLLMKIAVIMAIAVAVALAICWRR
ncbi:MAG: hypothetical protein SH850_06285 [Planctomycetaceae bacterium]|nr:hypothetical protein [Planctomycetaceae bacterium]